MNWNISYFLTLVIAATNTNIWTFSVAAESTFISRSGAESRLYQSCRQLCGSAHKICVRPPSSCGGCLDGFHSLGDACLHRQPPDLDDSAVDFANSRRTQGDSEISLAEKSVPNTVGQGKDTVFFAIVAGCSVAGLVGLIIAGFCYYKVHHNAKEVNDAEYPSYGVTGPCKETSNNDVGNGDRKLAHSAQMYHYQHQKQQMIAMEQAQADGQRNDASDEDSEVENDEGDYTVYECPGLATTGEMEVRNPLFSETPITSGSKTVDTKKPAVSVDSK